MNGYRCYLAKILHKSTFIQFTFNYEATVRTKLMTASVYGNVSAGIIPTRKMYLTLKEVVG